MSAVEIVNEALDRVGKKRIVSFDDKSVEARLTKTEMPRVMRELQARYSWDFNLTVAEIAANEDASPFAAYKYAHTLPADYLRLRLVEPVRDPELPNELDLSYNPRVSTDLNLLDLRAYVHQRRFTVPIIDKLIAANAVHTNFSPVRLVYHRYMGVANIVGPARAVQGGARGHHRGAHRVHPHQGPARVAGRKRGRHGGC